MKIYKKVEDILDWDRDSIWKFGYSFRNQIDNSYKIQDKVNPYEVHDITMILLNTINYETT